MRKSLFIILLFLSIGTIAHADLIELFAGHGGEELLTDTDNLHQFTDTIISTAILPNGQEQVVRTMIRERDECGNLLKETSYGLYSENGVLNDQLIPYSFCENTLDSIGRIISSTRFQYDVDVNHFFPYLRHTHHYTDDGACLMIRFRKNTQDEWVTLDTLLISATYNERLDPVEILVQKLSENNSWRNSTMTSYIYDSLARVTLRETFIWDSISWNYQTRQQFFYESDTLSAQTQSRIWSQGKWKRPRYSLAGAQVPIKRRIITNFYNGGRHISEQQTQAMTNEEPNKQEIKHRRVNKSSKKGFYLNTGTAPATVTIFNSNGRQLRNLTTKGVTYVNFSQWGKGNYSLRIIQNGRTTTRRIRIN